MTAPKSQKSPQGLAKGGRELWNAVAKIGPLRADHLRLLEDAAFTADLIDRLQADLKTSGTTTFGSQRQIVAHPNVSEIRQHRQAFRALLWRSTFPSRIGTIPRDAGGSRIGDGTCSTPLVEGQRMTTTAVRESGAEILARLEYSDDDQLPIGWPQDQNVATAGPDVLAWCETTLAQPDGDNAGEPWRWRESQARFVAWWYALDCDGNYLWRHGQVVLPKGAGKSPMAAALACAELSGPVRFVGWAEDGSPIMEAHPSPSVKLSALSQDQAEDATMSLAIAMLTSPAAGLAIAGLDAGLTRIRTRSGTLTAASAKAPSKEGLRPTAVILDETHLWASVNGGIRLAETLRRGVAKTGGRSLETSNMWINGAQSVAELTFDYAQGVRAGKYHGDGVLRWQPVAHCDDLGDHDELIATLGALYADSPWIDVERIAAEVIDGGTHPADARRYYLNMPGSADDSWLRADRWHGCLDRSHPLKDGDTVTLGFDGSHGAHGAMLTPQPSRRIRVRDGHVALLGCWQAGDGDDDWTPPDALIDAAVRDAFGRYKVVGFYADPALWQSQLTEWDASSAGILKVKATNDHPAFFWANRTAEMVKAFAAFEEAVSNGDMTHDGSYRLTDHCLNARRVVRRVPASSSGRHIQHRPTRSTVPSPRRSRGEPGSTQRQRGSVRFPLSPIA